MKRVPSMVPALRRAASSGAVLAILAVAVVLPELAGTVLPPALVSPIMPEAHAETPAPNAPRPAQIDRNGVLILIRSTLIALQQANETGNYTVLRDLAAPGFQQSNNPARLGEIFANLRAQKLDLSGVTVLDPQLTLLPQIESNGLMHMAGFFPSVPTQINFELLFAGVDGRWKPFGISVRLGTSSPVAPTSPPAAAPPKNAAPVQGAEKPAVRSRRKQKPPAATPAPATEAQ